MKTKKPSLLDMENFVQARASKKTPNNSKAAGTPPAAADNVGVPQKSMEQPVSQSDLLEAMKYLVSEIAPKEKESPAGMELKVDELVSEIQKLKNELSQVKMDHLKLVSDSQNSIMELQNEMSKLKENNIEAVRSLVDIKSKYQDLKVRLDKMKETKPPEKKPEPAKEEKETKTVSSADENYKNLIYKNVVMLMDEKGFTPLDVTKLFKLEGFAIFSPYVEWNERTVTMIYQDAKRAGFQAEPKEDEKKPESPNNGFTPGEIPPELILPQV